MIRFLLTRTIARDFGRNWADATVSATDRLPGRAMVYRRLMYAWLIFGLALTLALAVWLHFHPD